MKHVIADAKFNAKAASWVDCSCGQRVTAHDPEELNDPFQVHRALNGQLYRRDGMSDLKAPADFTGNAWRTVSKKAPKRTKVPT